MKFVNSITNWYLKNKRDLPWRQDTNPYSIWLSEIILQQTRIDQGLNYYLAFINKYPSIEKLAKAEEDEVLNLWQGLGYYSRARNLHYTAKFISHELKNKFPVNYKELLKLKGVGPYTAAAIASISYNECVAVVDGNVYRVLARYFNIKTPINTTEGVKQFKTIADKLIENNKHPGDYNQAIMEYGALICKPSNPLCDECCIKNTCEAYHHKTIKNLPVKIRKIKKKTRFFNYIVIKNQEGKYLIKKRIKKDIWQNLHDFHLIEEKKELTFKDLLTNKFITENQLHFTESNIKSKQELTHQSIHFQFHVFETKTNVKEIDESYFFIDKMDFKNYAFPKTVNEYILKEII